MIHSVLSKIFFFILIFASCVCSSQELDNESEKNRNEFKIDLPFLILESRVLQLSYEHLNENSGFGLTAFIPLSDNLSYTSIFLIQQRFYMGKKFASGFFFDFNGGLISQEVSTNSNSFAGNRLTIETNKMKESKLGLGVAAGVKINSNDFAVDIFGGVGKVFNSSEEKIYPRFGIFVGPRF